MSNNENIKKKAFILTHLGLGDNITCMGIVRYFATIYDEIYVVCKKVNEKNVRLFYQDNIKIKLYVIDTTNVDDISTHFGFSTKANAKYIYNNEEYDLITTGCHGPVQTSCGIIPFCFYKDVNLDYSIFWDYSYIIDTNESLELYNEILNNNIKDYIICHNSCSSGKVFKIEDIESKRNISRDDILIINIGENIYTPGHKYYEIANKFVMKPLLHYKDTLINSSEIYISDSSFFCMAILLNIKTDKCYIVSRGRNYNYVFTEQFKFNPNKTRKFTYPF